MKKTARHDEIARPSREGHGSPRRAAAAAAALLALAALTAGCASSSGASVASDGSSQQAAAGANGAKPSTLAYAQCMIAHGIKNFPEPSASGQLSISSGAQVPDVNSPQFQTAAKACVSLNPAGTELSQSQLAQQLAALVKYAKCMRSHGVPDFPDPGTNGTFDLGGINAASPQVTGADKACSSPGVGIFQPQRTSA
jgi:hypothetical protein